MRFETQWNPDYSGSGHETLDQTVITVPNMSLSVKDIINRFSRGTLDLRDIERSGYYDDDADLDDDTLDEIDDIVDVERIKRHLNEKVSGCVRSDLADFDERFSRVQEQGRRAEEMSNQSGESKAAD